MVPRRGKEAGIRMQERQADGGSDIEGKKTDDEHTTRIQKDAQDTQG